MSYKLTASQQAIYDGMISFQERKSFLEECELEAEYHGEPANEDQKPPLDQALPIVEPEVEPALDPKVEPKESQVDVPVVDDVDWRKEAETWKKRKADADKALTPIQQENAKLRKEAESQAERFDRLESLLKEATEVKAKVETIAPDDDEFAQAYPDVEKRIAKSKLELQEAFDKQLKELKDAERKREELAVTSRQETYQVKHETQVKAVHPDIADYFNPDKLAPALAEWVKGQPPMIANVLTNPLGHTPQDVIFAINSFKDSMNKPAAKTPSLGDRVQAAKSATNVSDPVVLDYFTDEEMSDKNIERLLRDNKRDPAKMDAILEKFERTLKRT